MSDGVGCCAWDDAVASALQTHATVTNQMYIRRAKHT